MPHHQPHGGGAGQDRPDEKRLHLFGEPRTAHTAHLHQGLGGDHQQHQKPGRCQLSPGAGGHHRRDRPAVYHGGGAAGLFPAAKRHQAQLSGAGPGGGGHRRRPVCGAAHPAGGPASGLRGTARPLPGVGGPGPAAAGVREHSGQRREVFHPRRLHLHHPHPHRGDRLGDGAGSGTGHLAGGSGKCQGKVL